MAEYGMEQCKIDPCVFGMVVDGKVELVMAVHVDDIVQNRTRHAENSMPR